MRYIDIDKLRVDEDWITRSRTAALAVEGGADPNTYASIWRELKASMSTMLNFKCWYCESPVDRSDNAVDHFRPKNNVMDASNPHSGYRWLAFNKNNFRLACTFCNSRRIDVEFGTAGGKADRFPLLDESKRVYSDASTEQEEPELLDPCDISDWELLGCQQENGKPCPTKEDDITLRRVATSIEVYHLDRDATCIQRHGIAVGLIADTIIAKKLFELSQADGSYRKDFQSVAKQIERALSKSSPYSGEMRFLFRGQRSEKHEWMQLLLET